MIVLDGTTMMETLSELALPNLSNYPTNGTNPTGTHTQAKLLLGLKRLHGFLEVTTAQVWDHQVASELCFEKDLEDMELESTISGPTAKLPILKLVPLKQLRRIAQPVSKMSIPITAKEKTNKKNDVKARGLLLMTLPNEHQITFSQYPDAKSMFAAIETKFGGNETTKKLRNS
ncbi:hypothetical protein Tco_0287672 [Tanacetum coccineum]